MTCQLVFIHGRSQQMKDADALKREWIASLERGLAKSGLHLPVAPSDIRFPYYGQTLFDIAGGASEEAAARVAIRGSNDGEQESDRREFIAAVLTEVARERGIGAADIDSASRVRGRGPLQWEWVQKLLEGIDRHLPGASGASIALATNDVYQYLRNPGIAGLVDAGVRQAFQRGVPTVVVSHSLGTVVAYNLLRRDGVDFGWNIPLFVTLGSPLAVKAIHDALVPIRFPACAAGWLNASDPRDVVALRPLDEHNFDVDPAIDNKNDVANHTENRHGIVGYLDDREVARRIHDALLGSA